MKLKNLQQAFEGIQQEKRQLPVDAGHCPTVGIWIQFVEQHAQKKLQFVIRVARSIVAKLYIRKCFSPVGR